MVCLLLHTMITGKAQEAYAAVSVEYHAEYLAIKVAIWKAMYEIILAVYRKTN